MRATPRTHRIRLAAPLECEEETHHAWDKQGRAWEVELPELLGQGQHAGVSVGDLEEEGDDGHGDAADGQVKVETPPPRHIRGKTAADQRARDGGDAKEGAKQALNLWPDVQRDDVDDAHDLDKMFVRARLPPSKRTDEAVIGSRGEKKRERPTDPAKIPAAPIPQNALPMMKAVEFGAAPQRADAASNSRMLSRRTVLTGKKV